MAEGNNSAAALLASSPIKIENISIPGFGGQASSEAFSPENYKVRYQKFDLDDPMHIAELETVETRGLRGVDIVVLNKQSYTFMDRYMLIVTYLEKNVS
jgi:hypothetical protein